MSTVLLAVALATTLESSPTTGRLPDRRNGINVQAWRVYTQELLEKIFPEDYDRISTVQITFVEDDEINAYASFELNVFLIHFGLLRFVRDEAEYAFIMTHEGQHILNRHGPTTRATGWFSVREDFALLRRQEITADILAMDTMRYTGIDACGGARLIAHLVRHFRTHDEPKDPYNIIGLRRKRIADYYCRQSKTTKYSVTREP